MCNSDDNDTNSHNSYGINGNFPDSDHEKEGNFPLTLMPVSLRNNMHRLSTGICNKASYITKRTHTFVGVNSIASAK